MCSAPATRATWQAPPRAAPNVKGVAGAAGAARGRALLAPDRTAAARGDAAGPPHLVCLGLEALLFA